MSVVFCHSPDFPRKRLTTPHMLGRPERERRFRRERWKQQFWFSDFLPWEQHRRCCWTRDRWGSSETTHWYIWAWTCKSEIFVKIQQQHSVFSLHVLDNVEDGKEKYESGSPDADVGEDENTGHFNLWNLPRSKHQRIIRCGIHLLPKNITSINKFSSIFTWQ